MTTQLSSIQKPRQTIKQKINMLDCLSIQSLIITKNVYKIALLTSLISLTNESAKNNCVTPPFNPFIYVPEEYHPNR